MELPRGRGLRGGRGQPAPGGVLTHTRRYSVGRLCNRHQVRWPPSSFLAVWRIKGPTSTGNSIWKLWVEGKGRRSWYHTGTDTSREVPRREAIFKAESSKNSGAHKDSNPQSSPLLLPKRISAADEVQAEMKVSAGLRSEESAAFCRK